MNGSAIDSRISWAVDYMQRHLAQPMTVGEIAARVNLSPSRYRALFRAQTGVGPVRFLQRLRLRRARLLIERTFLTVKEVMALVGYNDPSHFTRDFRRHHGAPPTAFRSQGMVASLPSGRSPSVDPLTHRRIGQPRVRGPGPSPSYGEICESA